MRDRRHRTGYRTGAMSEAVQKAIDTEVERLSALDEPADQIRAVGDFFAALDIELAKVGKVRLQAIATLRSQGLTYQRIADLTDLSYPRVAQLARDAKVGGRAPKPR